jgi:hypothetical protein
MNRKPWTPAEEAELRALYPRHTCSEIGRRMGRSVASINGRAQLLRLMKPEGYDYPTRLKPGHTRNAWTGKKLPWGAPPTAFKPGQDAPNKAPLGTFRINGAGYLSIKVQATGYQPRDWEPYHRYVWRQAHGPIPQGHVVTFREGRHSTDPAHITVAAIECIPRAEHSPRNWHFARLPRPIAELIHLRGHLTKLINKHTKEHTA